MYWHRHADLLRLLYCVTFIFAGGASTFLTSTLTQVNSQSKVTAPAMQARQVKTAVKPKIMAAKADHAHVPSLNVPAGQPAVAKILMFKTSSCDYCSYFDKKVRPFFLKHPVSRAMPLEDIDFHIQGTNYYPLRAPVKVFPTFVIFKEGREIGRISGYMAKEPFLAALNHFFPAMMKQDLSMIQQRIDQSSGVVAQLTQPTMQ